MVDHLRKLFGTHACADQKPFRMTQADKLRQDCIKGGWSKIGKNKIEKGVHVFERGIGNNDPSSNTVDLRISTAFKPGTRIDVCGRGGCRSQQKGCDGQHSRTRTNIEHPIEAKVPVVSLDMKHMVHQPESQPGRRMLASSKGRSVL